MRILLQRVAHARVTVEQHIVAEISAGLLIFVGVGDDDTDTDCERLSKKIVNLRIFDDEAGVMNKSVLDAGGGILAVSQFTLFASTAKGNRPSYSAAAKGEISKPRFEQFVKQLSLELGKEIHTGVFGADMKVALTNDGPVTIWLDSKVRQ
jgi:D-aminoacyl-tRNA deacylase